MSDGGGGGSSGVSWGDPATLIGAFFTGLAIVFALQGVGWVGQHVYEATHNVHIAKVAGDWGSLFFNIGLAVILTPLGILLLVGAAIARKLSVLAVGVVAIVLAAVCGLVLAPHFEAKVSGSPTAAGRAAQVPKSFAGTWVGTGYQSSDQSRWTIRMTLRAGARAAAAGRITYPSLACGGVLTLESIKNGHARILEDITDGEGACVDYGIIDVRLLGKTKLDWRWSYPDGTQGAKATLTRQN